MTDFTSDWCIPIRAIIIVSVRHGVGVWFCDGGVMCSYSIDRNGWLPRNRGSIIVLVFVMLCGVLGILLVRPGTTADVWAHVYRVDAMLNGDVLARPVRATSDYHHDAMRNMGGWVSGDVIAFSLVNDRDYVSGLVDPVSITTCYGRRCEVPFNNTAVYPPFAYLPQLAAFAVGRLLRSSTTIQFYLAEILQLGVYFASVCACLRLLSGNVLRWFRWLAGLLAVWMAMPFSFMFSPDSTLAALSLPLACLMVRCVEGNRFSAKDCVVLVSISGIITLAKFAYAPFLLMVLLPMAVYRRMDIRSRLILIGGCAISVLLLLAWVSVGTGFATNPSRVSYVEVVRRRQELLAAPQLFLLRMLYSVIRLQGWSWWEPPLLLLFWTLSIMALTLTVIAWRKNRRCLLFWLTAWVAAAGCVMLIYVAVWMQFTLDGQQGVIGINSRYFLPLVPLLAMQCAAALQSIRQDIVNKPVTSVLRSPAP
ncbi:DUF2142 domain-containing protein [Bifidobacterium sp. LC6]|uniref:DUF2142 domain-containing protein n=1 Tax=Bifidobacterium colobi TaxID=2809026 RepID=A0ABS5UZN2_9BIFI|nr:DUF2142 domain-containing protein [Bifidobacterium colobi]MBT1175906.1 DUF2142 domain-containing protein [Bifidobacterium colobi]